jgi:hypothetical protein
VDGGGAWLATLDWPATPLPLRSAYSSASVAG